MEGGVHKASTNEFRECLQLTWTRPYILKLAVSAGIGGLLFGYDTGVISGALLYIRDDFRSVEKNTSLQEAIVSTAIAGAIIGAAVGGWINDRWGRRMSILIADFLFCVGAIVMAVAPTPVVIIVGRVGVGVGVGMASMTSPLYISEVSPARIRGALVSTNGLLITGGQFAAYCINLAFTKVPGTWRWMLGVAAFPAVLQFVFMWFLPESPRWLYRKGREEEAIEILKKIYSPEEVATEVEALKLSIETEIKEEGPVDGGNIFTKVKDAWSSPIVRQGLIAGIGLQVAQQFVGINTVMYYSPTIVQLAGFASNSTALSLSLITSGLNAVGSVLSMACVDKFGRRRLLLISMVGIIVCLFGLFGVFYGAAHHSPHVDGFETARFGNGTCSSFLTSRNSGSWSCYDCLAHQDCGFCAHPGDTMRPGVCLANEPATKTTCRVQKSQWYTQGCPSKFGWVALIGLGAYIISYSPGMGTVPWVINSEIYPLRHRGICGGMAAVANWISNLIVSQSFLSLTVAVGSAMTFLIFGCVSMVCMVFIYFRVPETKGLQFEEVEEMLRNKSLTYKKKPVGNQPRNGAYPTKAVV